MVKLTNTQITTSHVGSSPGQRYRYIPSEHVPSLHATKKTVVGQKQASDVPPTIPPLEATKKTAVGQKRARPPSSVRGARHIPRWTQMQERPRTIQGGISAYTMCSIFDKNMRAMLSSSVVLNQFTSLLSAPAVSRLGLPKLTALTNVDKLSAQSELIDQAPQHADIVEPTQQLVKQDAVSNGPRRPPVLKNVDKLSTQQLVKQDAVSNGPRRPPVLKNVDKLSTQQLVKQDAVSNGPRRPPVLMNVDEYSDWSPTPPSCLTSHSSNYSSKRGQFSDTTNNSNNCSHYSGNRGQFSDTTNNSNNYSNYSGNRGQFSDTTNNSNNYSNYSSNRGQFSDTTHNSNNYSNYSSNRGNFYGTRHPRNYMSRRGQPRNYMSRRGQPRGDTPSAAEWQSLEDDLEIISNNIQHPSDFKVEDNWSPPPPPEYYSTSASNFPRRRVNPVLPDAAFDLVPRESTVNAALSNLRPEILDSLQQTNPRLVEQFLTDPTYFDRHPHKTAPSQSLPAINSAELHALRRVDLTEKWASKGKSWTEKENMRVLVAVNCALANDKLFGKGLSSSLFWDYALKKFNSNRSLASFKGQWKKILTDKNITGHVTASHQAQVMDEKTMAFTATSG